MLRKFVLDEKKETLLLKPVRYFHDGTYDRDDEDGTDARKNNTLRSMSFIPS